MAGIVALVMAPGSILRHAPMGTKTRSQPTFGESAKVVRQHQNKQTQTTTTTNGTDQECDFCILISLWGYLRKKLSLKFCQLLYFPLLSRLILNEIKSFRMSQAFRVKKVTLFFPHILV